MGSLFSVFLRKDKDEVRHAAAGPLRGSAPHGRSAGGLLR